MNFRIPCAFAELSLGVFLAAVAAADDVSLDEIVIVAFCGAQRARATYLAERSISCGTNPDTHTGALIAVCGK